MEIDKKDLIDVLEAQRNVAQRESAVNFAYAKACERRIKELEEQVAKLKPAADPPA